MPRMRRGVDNYNRVVSQSKSYYLCSHSMQKAGHQPLVLNTVPRRQETGHIHLPSHEFSAVRERNKAVTWRDLRIYSFSSKFMLQTVLTSVEFPIITVKHVNATTLKRNTNQTVWHTSHSFPCPSLYPPARPSIFLLPGYGCVFTLSLTLMWLEIP